MFDPHHRADTMRHPDVLDPSDHIALRIREQRDLLTRTLRLIHNFAEMLIEDPLGIELRDELELPVDKETMIDCFTLVLMAENRPEWRTAFYNSGLKLAYFWPGIGPDRLFLPDGVFDDDPHSRAAATIAANADQIRRFSEAYARVGAEHRRIAAIFDQVGGGAGIPGQHHYFTER